MAKYAYTPRDPTAPSEMEWNGIKFRANVFIDFDPVRHSYLVPIVKKWVDEATQEPRTKAYEKRVSMLDIARGNPDFTVEGDAPVTVPKVGGKGKAPKTPEEYRAHALAWIQTATSIDDLARWNDEELLREKCGCGEDDIAYLQPHFDAKFQRVKASDEEAA